MFHLYFISSTGFLCTCSSRFIGTNCELNTQSFNGKGLVWLPSLKSSITGSLSLEFSTVYKNGLLLYSGPTFYEDYVTNGMFVILLRDGKIQVKVLLQDILPEVVEVDGLSSLHDGEWHLVEIYYNATVV